MSGSEKQEIKFGTSGWRGIISDDFTAENVAIVAQAISNYLNKEHESGKNGVVIGYDTRFMSERFAHICANILKNNNIKIFMTDRDTPTPVIGYEIINKNAQGGINITASHNPPEYNGIKYSSSNGGPASGEITKKIEAEINDIQSKNQEVKYSADKSGLSFFDPKPEYVKHISKLVDLKLIKKSGIRVVVDCLWGTLRGYLGDILEKDGIKVTVLHDVINPFFGGGRPDPSSEERLKELKIAVKKTKANLGLATDGDSDRFGIVDAGGVFISANHMLPLILEHLIKTRKHNGGIVRSITTTRMLDLVAKKFNRDVHEVPVGFKYVGSGVVEHNAIMGCEESSGMTIFGHIPEKDGILACLLVAEMIAYNNKKSIKDLLKRSAKEYGKFYSTRVDVPLKQEDKEAVFSKLKNNPLKECAGLKVSKYEVLPSDNIKIEFTDGGWIMVRPSGTEPIVRCYCETTSAKKLPILEKELKKLVS